MIAAVVVAAVFAAVRWLEGRAHREQINHLVHLLAARTPGEAVMLDRGVSSKSSRTAKREPLPVEVLPQVGLS